MRLDALAEAVRLLSQGGPDEDPAYEAAVAVQVRRRGMHRLKGETG
jgi:hypothetical protein